MAAPVASGAAAIVKSVFPLYSALQIAEVLKSTSDLIDTVNSPQYQNKLGVGRINLYNAISDTLKPGIILTNYSVSDKNDELWINGDTLNLVGNFKNVLKDANTLVIQAISNSNYVTVINNSFNIGTLLSNDTISNFQAPFKLILKNNIPSNHTFKVILKYSALGYTSYECIEIRANEDILNITINDIKTSVSSKGYLGYNNYYQSQGLGVVYNQNNLLFNGSFIIGNAVTQVSDNLMATINSSDEDFYPLSKALRNLSNSISDFDVVSSYDDRMASSSKLNVTVKQLNYAWNNANDRKYIFYTYQIINNGITPLGSVYGGIYADWDIKNPALNTSTFSSSYNIVYAKSTQPNTPYVGLQLLNHHNSCKYYALDIINDKDINFANGFSSEEKFILLTNNVSQAGSGAGTDIASYVGAGPFYMEPNDTIQIDIALVVADSLSELFNVAALAKEKYNENFVGIKKLDNVSFKYYPNPADNYVFIESVNTGKLEILSIDGKLNKLVQLNKGNNYIDISELSDGAYILKYIPDNQGEQVVVNKLIIE